MVGTKGTDYLAGTSGDDVLYDFNGGNDTYLEGEGDYLIELDRVSANDALDGEGGNDFCLADRGDTRANCERGIREA